MMNAANSLRLAALVIALSWTGSAAAQLSLYENEEGDVTLDLGGYARSFGGVTWLTYDTADLVPELSGNAANILRLEWSSNLGEVVTLDLHNRFLLNIRSGGSALAVQGFGVGVSAAPERLLDTATAIIDEQGLYFEHDLDRFMVRLYLEAVDLYIGRQPISWGNSNLFLVADFWAPLSPFDLDNSQKRGIDAIRLLWAPTEEGDVELDFVLADRGASRPGEDPSLDNLSGGVRATFYLDFGDLYTAAAKIWDQAVLIFGVAGAPSDEVALKLRGEVVGVWRFDKDTPELPRATVGLGYFGEDGFIAFEYHFNGVGTLRSEDYITHAQESVGLARGESYFIGQHYLGFAGVYNVTEYFSLNGSLVFNVADPSLLIAAGANYAVSENVDLSLGTFNGIGAPPTIDLVAPALGSEFGAAGQNFYLQLAAFF